MTERYLGENYSQGDAQYLACDGYHRRHSVVGSSGDGSVVEYILDSMDNHPSRSPSSKPNMGRSQHPSPSRTTSSADSRTTNYNEVVSSRSTSCMSEQLLLHPSYQT